MGVQGDVRRYLTVIEMLLRRSGAAGVMDLARATGLPFGTACSVVSRLDRERLVEHLPHSGIFVTERGRALLADFR